MILLQVAADLLDHLVVGVSSSHEAAFAVDELCHAVPPVGTAFVVRPERCGYVDETLSKPLGGKVQVCGRLVIEIGGTRVEGLLPGRLGRLLFVYLVLNRTRDVTPDELVEALWADGAPDHARATLRTLVSKLRRAVGSDLSAQGHGYRLRFDGDVRIDVEQAVDAIHRAESAVASGDWTRAWGPSLVALFTARRGLLPGEEAAWINERRARLRELELRALECYASAALGIGGVELAAAERTSRTLIEREPFRESGYRLLMRALADRGNVADALRVYEQLKVLLREELGVSPSPPTQALHVSLLRLT